MAPPLAPWRRPHAAAVRSQGPPLWVDRPGAGYRGHVVGQRPGPAAAVRPADATAWGSTGCPTGRGSSTAGGAAGRAADAGRARVSGQRPAVSRRHAAARLANPAGRTARAGGAATPWRPARPGEQAPPRRRHAAVVARR